MQSNTIVIISGYARAGKDTVGAHLTNPDTYSLKRYSFAAKLKEAAMRLTVWDKVEIDGNTEYVERPYWDGRDETKRHPCVQLGKVMRDVVSPTIWVDALLADSQFEQDVKRHGVVITDCRYLNELHAIQAKAQQWNADWLLFWVERDVEPQGEELEKTTPLREHASVLPNYGTIDDLITKVDTALQFFQQLDQAA